MAVAVGVIGVSHDAVDIIAHDSVRDPFFLGQQPVIVIVTEIDRSVAVHDLGLARGGVIDRGDWTRAVAPVEVRLPIAIIVTVGTIKMLNYSRAIPVGPDVAGSVVSRVFVLGRIWINHAQTPIRRIRPLLNVL